MSGYKSEVTLNEKDTLIDILNTEKAIINGYAHAISSSLTKQYRITIKDNFTELSNDQLNVYLHLTDKGYLKSESAKQEQMHEIIKLFEKLN